MKNRVQAFQHQTDKIRKKQKTSSVNSAKSLFELNWESSKNIPGSIKHKSFSKRENPEMTTWGVDVRSLNEGARCQTASSFRLNSFARPSSEERIRRITFMTDNTQEAEHLTLTKSLRDLSIQTKISSFNFLKRKKPSLN